MTTDTTNFRQENAGNDLNISKTNNDKELTIIENKEDIEINNLARNLSKEKTIDADQNKNENSIESLEVLINQNVKKTIDIKMSISNHDKFVPINVKSQKVNETFLEWSSRTDINSFGKIFDYRGNFLAQTIWTLVFMILTGLTLALIQMSISEYFRYEVTSTYDVVYERPTEFPTITICSGSPFSTKQAADLLTKIALNNIPIIQISSSIISVG